MDFYILQKNKYIYLLIEFVILIDNNKYTHFYMKKTTTAVHSRLKSHLKSQL